MRSEISALEDRIRQIEQRVGPVPEAAAQPRAKHERVDPRVQPSEAAASVLEAGLQVPPDEPVTEEPVQPELVPERISAGWPVRPPHPEPRVVPTSREREPASPGVREKLTAAVRRTKADAADWETLIGGQWLNKLGIVVLVIGVALFLGYSLRYMGPAGRVVTGFGTSVALLAVGVLVERRAKYALFGRPFIGGGWALLYFTAFAAYNLQAAKIIDDPLLAIVLLGVVAAGIIAHSLRYRSQIVTGLAYVLGFLTVAISPVTSFSLVASVVLAASLVALLRRTRWSILGLFGLVATYLNHALWLEVRMGGFTSRPSAETFWLAQGLLVVYWLVFTSYDFILDPELEGERRAGVGINLANTLAFLGLSFRQVGAMSPEAAYLLAGLGGLAYVVTSFALYAVRRRVLYRINAVVAGTLVALALLLKLSPEATTATWLGPAWLAEAAVLLALGLVLREMAFRVQSYGLTLLAAGSLVAVNLGGGGEISHLLRWITIAPAVAYVYFLFERLRRSRAADAVAPIEEKAGVAFSYVGAVLLAALVGKESGAPWLGLGWLATALLLIESGLRFRGIHLRIQGYGLGGLAAGALLLVNLYGVAGGGAAAGPASWIVVAPAAAVWYYLFARLQGWSRAGHASEAERRWAAVPGHVATALLTVLLWKELDAVAVALAWGFLGLALHEIGGRLREAPLRAQGHVLAALAFGRLFLANFTAPGEFLFLSHRVITVLPIVAILYYVRSGLKEDLGGGRAFRFEPRLPQMYSYAAAILLVVLARFELGRAHTVIGWAVLGLLFLSLGISGRDRDFRIQSYVLAALTVWRSWATNFYLTGTLLGLPERIATTIPAIAALYAAKALCIVKKKALPEARGAGLAGTIDAHPRVVFSLAGTLLVTLLLFYEIQGNLLTIAWTVEGFVLLAFGFTIRERTFRLSGLALLMACLLKVFIIDLRGVETLYRIFSFIVLGVILLVVSFGYTRYRELLRRYL